MLFKNNDGSALIWVLITLIVLSILGIAFLNFTTAEAKHTRLVESKVQANYLARSGVLTGQKMLEYKIFNESYSDIDIMCNDLNTEALNGAFTTISNVGSFNIEFNKINSNTIKIKSTGKTEGFPQVTDIASLTVNVTLPSMSNIATNPAEWLTSQGGSLTNPQSQKILKHNVTGSDLFLGKMVILNGGVKATKYPQGGGHDAESTYRASILSLTTTRSGIPCLSQDSQNLNIIFDAEIIFFGDSIQANKDKDIILSVSDSVLNRPVSGILSTDPSLNGMGFESFERYKALILQYNPSMPVDKTIWDRYNFNGKYTLSTPNSYKYGIVCFMKPITSIANIPNNYYFFPSDNTNGMSIRNPDKNGSVLGYNELIPIAEDDPLRDVLDKIYNMSGHYSVSHWDNE